MLRGLAALMLIPLADALLLVFVAAEIGAVLTVLIVVLTALVGTLLVRAEGRHTLRRIQRKVHQGEAPTGELLDGGLLVAAGAFALTPGLVTDAIALLLVIPVTRAPIRMLVKRYVVVPYMDKKTGGFASGQVYVGGFPDEGDGPAGVNFGPQGPGGGGGEGAGDDVYDVDSDAYDIDLDDDSDGTNV